MEVRLTEDGEICSRGPDLCLGYTDDALTARAFDDDGWYHTGDIGVFDEDGYLTITDRTADLIIRGGENISAVEVEEVLLSMPGVAEAVVVAAPDPRYGEHAAAVLRMLDGQELPGIEAVRAHFEAAGMARQKWPEQLVQVDDFPAPPAARCRSTGSARSSPPADSGLLSAVVLGVDPGVVDTDELAEAQPVILGHRLDAPLILCGGLSRGALRRRTAGTGTGIPVRRSNSGP